MLYLSDVNENQLAQFNKKKVKVKSFVRKGKVVNSYDRFLKIFGGGEATPQNFRYLNWKNLGLAAGSTLGVGILLRNTFKKSAPTIVKNVDNVVGVSKALPAVQGSTSRRNEVAQSFLGDILPENTSVPSSVVSNNKINTLVQTNKNKISDPWLNIIPDTRQTTTINKSINAQQLTPRQQLLLPPARSSNVKANVANDNKSVSAKKLTVYGIPEDAPVIAKLQEIAKRARLERKGAQQPRKSRRSFRLAADKTEESILSGTLTPKARQSKDRLLKSQENSIQNKTESIDRRKQNIKSIREEWEVALKRSGYVPKKQQRKIEDDHRRELELEQIRIRKSGKKGFIDDNEAKKKLGQDFKASVERNKRIQNIKRQIKEQTALLSNKTNIGVIDNYVQPQALDKLKRLREQYSKEIADEIVVQQRNLSRLRNPVVKNYEQLKEELFTDLVGSTLPKTVNSSLINSTLGKEVGLAYKTFNQYKDFEKLWADYEKWGKTQLTRRELGILTRNFGTKMAFKKPADTSKVMTAISNIFKTAPQYKMALQKSGLNPIEVKLSPEDYERLIRHYAMGQGDTVRLLLRFLGLPV